MGAARAAWTAMVKAFLTDPIYGDAITTHFDTTALIADLAEVEAALAEAQASLGVIPEAAGTAIGSAARGLSVDPEDLAAGTAAAGVPIPALVAAIRTAVGPPHDDWVHWGATSQDVVDCAFMLAYGRGLAELAGRLSAVIDALEARSAQFGETVFAGRTRGQIATPITLGLRVAQWAQPLIALENEVAHLRHQALRVQFGGASGAQSAIAPHGVAVAEGLGRALGLEPGPPWHTDRTPVRLISGWLGRLVAALAKMAGDVVLLSRSEIAEARAGGGGGSSTMPQKSNPVTAEAVLSIARVVLGCEAGLGAAATHAEERDGGNWAVEWLLMPQLFTLAGAALRHGARLAETLEANEDAMAARLRAVPEVMAEAVVFALAPSLGRQAAQALVKDALAAPEPFAAALQTRGPEGFDWDPVLSPDAVVAPSQAVAKGIFAARR